MSSEMIPASSITLTSNQFWHVSNDDYHAETDHVSHSVSELYEEKGPRGYEGFILHRRWAKKKTAAMQLGSDFHDAILRPGIPIGSDVMEIPESALSASGSKAGDKWTDFAEANASKVLCKTGEPILEMTRALQRNEKAMELLSAEGFMEVGLQYTDPASLVRCKVKWDKIHHKAWFIADIKTTNNADVEKFVTYCSNGPYYRQAAWYQVAAELLAGITPAFYFIVVETEPPFRCIVFKPHQDDIDTARRQNESVLKDMKPHFDSGDWSDKAEKGVVEYRARHWFGRDEYKLSEE